MKFLLDTHTLLWWLMDDKKLSAHARQAIGNSANEVFVSAISAWEISIKKALGKLEAPGDLPQMLGANGFTELPIFVSDGLEAGSLPPHHQDPFDRMLIAQARRLELTIITSDKIFRRYKVQLLKPK